MITKFQHRLLHLDFLRGLFLCVIIVDHLQKFPAIYDLFTGRGILWASAAEGFFFLSGILLGLVRGRREQQQPMMRVANKLWRRAGVLYFWSVGLTLLFTLFAFIFQNYVGLKPGYMIPHSPFAFLKEIFTLSYVYGWADFLQYYAVFIFISPLAIWLLRRNYWWAVLLISSVVWVMSGSNFYLSWQLLFFFGCVFGFYVKVIHAHFINLSRKQRELVIIITLVASGITFVVSYVSVLGVSFLQHRPGLLVGKEGIFSSLEVFNRAVATSFDKSSLGIGRIIIFFFWFFTLYFVVKKYPRLYERNKLGRAITFFGQNSLYVYIVHSVLIFFLTLIFPGNYGLLINFGVVTLVYWCIYCLLRKRVLFTIIPR